jgi:hypothetical protein
MYNNIKKGDILFAYGNSFISDLIEDLTHEGASHVCVATDSTHVIEAQGGRKVGYQNLSFYSTNIKVYRLPIPTYNMSLGQSWLVEQIGKPYDYWDIVVLSFWLLFKFKIPWKEYGAFICSSLTRNYIFQCKLNIPDLNMTPRDVEDWIIANGGVLLVDNVGKLK